MFCFLFAFCFIQSTIIHFVGVVVVYCIIYKIFVQTIFEIASLWMKNEKSISFSHTKITPDSDWSKNNVDSCLVTKIHTNATSIKAHFEMKPQLWPCRGKSCCCCQTSHRYSQPYGECVFVFPHYKTTTITKREQVFSTLWKRVFLRRLIRYMCRLAAAVAVA